MPSTSLLVPVAQCTALLAALLVAALGALGAAGPLHAQEDESAVAVPPKRFQAGEQTLIGGCLNLQVLDIADRSGLEASDWVTLRVTNQCNEPVRHLLVEFVLVDVLGQGYGARLWMLGRGEVLRAGGSKTERFAIPDTSNHVPRHWSARLGAVEKPSQRVRRPPPSLSQRLPAVRRP